MASFQPQLYEEQRANFLSCHHHFSYGIVSVRANRVRYSSVEKILGGSWTGFPGKAHAWT
jgi:hypothetical protein